MVCINTKDKLNLRDAKESLYERSMYFLPVCLSLFLLCSRPQWKEAKPEELMDSKLRCAFEMPLENDKTQTEHSTLPVERLMER